MQGEINFSKCRHFDTPGCPGQNLEVVKGAAETIAIPDLKGGSIQYIDTLDIAALNKMCARCEKYEPKIKKSLPG